ncbi:MAG TPA: hypothetical protein VEK73_20060 [Xanthobacteraceae bacterium]|nr:hypothetical protein [Xanthobacteraceae bacterium]
MITNDNRGGAVATRPEGRRQSDIRSGEEKDHPKPAQVETIKVPGKVRVRVTDGRLEVIEK